MAYLPKRNDTIKETEIHTTNPKFVDKGGDKAPETWDRISPVDPKRFRNKKTK